MKLDKLRPALLFVTFTLLLCSTAWAGSDVKSSDATEEVRAAAIAFNKAYAANDLEKYFSFYTDDATLVIPTGDVQTVAVPFHMESISGLRLRCREHTLV